MRKTHRVKSNYSCTFFPLSVVQDNLVTDSIIWETWARQRFSCVCVLVCSYLCACVYMCACSLHAVVLCCLLYVCGFLCVCACVWSLLCACQGGLCRPFNSTGSPLHRLNRTFPQAHLRDRHLSAEAGLDFHRHCSKNPPPAELRHPQGSGQCCLFLERKTTASNTLGTECRSLFQFCTPEPRACEASLSADAAF